MQRLQQEHDEQLQQEHDERLQQGDAAERGGWHPSGRLISPTSDAGLLVVKELI